MFKRLGRILARKRLKKVKESLEYAGISEDAAAFVGKHFTIAALLTALSSVFAYFYYGIFYAVGVGIGIPILYYLLITSIVSLLSEQRARYIEKILPDVLLLMSTNLKSGIPPEEALVLSARPEFGFLADRIKRAGRMLASGRDIKEVFLSLKKGISSPVFGKTIDLIVEGIESGGELSVLLESTANDIRETETIRKEVRSIIFVYALFIFMAGCLIAPVLYAVSIQLSSILSKLSTSIAIQFVTKKAVAVSLEPSGISPTFLTDFAYVSLLITSVFASFIVALINKGNEKYGIRYIPIFVAVSLIIFFVAKYILQMFFGGIRVV